MNAIAESIFGAAAAAAGDVLVFENLKFIGMELW